MSRFAEQRGQGTVEWVALVLVASVVLAGVGAIAGVGPSGAALANAIGSRIACAVGLSNPCDAGASPLAAAYGEELAGLASEHAPEVRYENGMRALPVDYRRCREDACANGAERGEVSRTLAGEPVTAFLHAIDCRSGPAIAPSPAPDCSGRRRGNLYLQYWFYYPGSATGEGSTPLRAAIREASSALGSPSYHPDDWESVQVRIGPGGSSARASSHHGYGGGWVGEHGSFFVAGGSHAGSMQPRDFERWTPAGALRLVALAPIAARRPEAEFAVTPPWRKRVWLDPEYAGTD